MTISREARLYLRPTAFVDAPFGRDGQVLRLAGGLIWFSALEVIAVEDGGRVSETLVPVERLEAFFADLPDAQREQAGTVLSRLTSPRPPLALGERVVRLDQPQIMAILNMTPDSFSDGGAHVDDPAGAAAAGIAMTAEGAAIVDVGGESTRPGAATVWEGDEIARVVPVIERLAGGGAAISIDTRKAAVMEAALVAFPDCRGGRASRQRCVGAALGRTVDRGAGGAELFRRADAPSGHARDDAGAAQLWRCADRNL
jgi:dihydropteroate synthase